MSLLINYDIAHQPVLIIGAGHVALRKAQEYLKQEAILTIRSIDFLDEFSSLHVTCIQEAYDASCVKGYQLVYAATNDRILNNQIVEDCKKQGILCLSATKAEVSSVLSYEDAYVAMGVSTKGTYPAINRILLEQMKALYEKEYAKKMPYLNALRKELLQSIDDREETKKRLRQLPYYPVSFLQFLLQAFQKKKACILVFHGVKIPSVITEEILPFLKQLSLSNDTYAYHFAYLSDMVIHTLNEEYMQVMSLEETLSLLQACHIPTQVYPMLMQDGRFHVQIKEIAQRYQAARLPLPFDSQQAVQELFDILQKAYTKPQHDLLIVYHSSERGAFANYVAGLKLQDTTYITQEKQVSALDTSHFMKDITIFSLYMLSGMHMQKDQEALMKKFHDHELTMIQKSCLQEASIEQLLIYKIISQTG